MTKMTRPMNVPDSAQTIVSAAVSQIEIGTVQSFRNLEVFPLVAKVARLASYITLDEALDRHLAIVTEVSEGGAVPELLFENQGDVPILLVDGEELVGARQNRVLNLTILAPARSKLSIPVSCVEAGRWSYTTRHFGSAKRAFYARGRASKMEQVSASLRESGTRRSDQGAIWDDISAKALRFGTRSATGAMADIYVDASAQVEEYAKAVKWLPGQVGAVFAIDREIVGAEMFDSQDIYKALMAKLMGSYVMEAIDHGSERERTISPDSARSFLRRIEGSTVERFKAVGDGEDLRLHQDGVVGGALVVDGRVVHLSAFKGAA